MVSNAVYSDVVTTQIFLLGTVLPRVACHVFLPISTIVKNISETQVDVLTVRKCDIISL